MRWIATVHVQMDVEADTEEEARAAVRQVVEGAGLRLSPIGASPSHSVNGVRLDVPLRERRRP